MEWLSDVGEWVAKYWVTAACTLFAGLIGKLWSKVKSTSNNQKAVHGAILALLRDRIYQSCQYHLKNKYIMNTDREVLNAMFDEYFAMGGNGVVKHLKAEIDALPTHIADIH